MWVYNAIVVVEILVGGSLAVEECRNRTAG